jgi:hypothetical protein
LRCTLHAVFASSNYTTSILQCNIAILSQAPLVPLAPPPEPRPREEPDEEVISDDEPEEEMAWLEKLVYKNEDDRVAEIGAYLLDWMGTNKATWESAKEVWHMLSMWCGFDLPVFSRVKRIAVAWFKGRAVKYEMCRNGCVAYYNCTHPSMQDQKYQNAGPTAYIALSCSFNALYIRTLHLVLTKVHDILPKVHFLPAKTTLFPILQNGLAVRSVTRIVG